MKKKTPFQLQALEKFFEEQRNPTRNEIHDICEVLELNDRQVQDWFVKRRKKCESGCIIRRDFRTAAFNDNAASCSDSLDCTDSLYKHEKKRRPVFTQELLSPEFILSKKFRKDGPPLGVEFESPPFMRFRNLNDKGVDSGNSCPPLQGNENDVQRIMIDGKPTEPMKHGMGKGLMTVWRATNPNGGDFPKGFNNVERWNKSKRRKSLSITRKLVRKTQELKKNSVKKMEKKIVQKVPMRVNCELCSEDVFSEELHDRCSLLLDDEELELRELRTLTNLPTCSEHCTSNGLYGCTLCKDFLPKFPPSSIKMKPPFALHFWNSCPETVKNLFKVVHFIYTYSVPVGICSFTLDELAQSFHDRDSLLLGKVHLALLNFLFSGMDAKVNSMTMTSTNVSSKYLALLDSVHDRDHILEHWKKSLNPLTWTEILRQVLVAAGFGSKKESIRKNNSSKEMRLRKKYGFCSRTLKGKLFTLLYDQGDKGDNVENLTTSPKIVELGLASSTEELEKLIFSTLSGDITLFEKISSSSYRLRNHASIREDINYSSETEYSGSVHDSANFTTTCDSDSEFDSKHNKSTVEDEIDESNGGEIWLLGLMESEYSDLGIEEKLTALVSLVELLAAKSCCRQEDPTRTLVESAFNPPLCGAGGKVKRLSSHQTRLRPTWVHFGQQHNQQLASNVPIDSSKINFEGLDPAQLKSHPMQSVFLGSDRRFNRYWLFLGPCNASDPGHKRVYVESSEDGHWEVIDTEEGLRSLISVLDDRGKREAHLLDSLEKREAFLRQEMSESNSATEQSCSPSSDVDNLSQPSKEDAFQLSAIVLKLPKSCDDHAKLRQTEFDCWIWDVFYAKLNAVKRSKRSFYESLARCETCNDLFWRDEKHCRICHKTFELDFDLEELYAVHSATCQAEEHRHFRVLPSLLQALKASVHAIESTFPDEALSGIWRKSAHKIWVKRLRRTSCMLELFQVVADFVGAINECKMDEFVSCFASISQTSSGLAMWLTRLDHFVSS